VTDAIGWLSAPMECPTCGCDVDMRRIEGAVGRSYAICPTHGARRPREPIVTGHYSIKITKAAVAIRQRVKFAASKIQLRVLVWGPSPVIRTSTGSLRVQIRRELKDLGHEALFSEEFPSFLDGQPTNLVEIMQMSVANLVVLLADSYGSLAELHDFGLLLGKKLLTWMPEVARGGYSATGLGRMMATAGNAPIFFSPDDVDSGVMVLASADWVENWRTFTVFQREREKLAQKLDPTTPIGI